MKREKQDVAKKDATPTFEEFWAAYPLHKAKKDAQKAWGKLSAKHKQEALAALPSYSEYCRQKGICIKYAQGWLNGQRWEDEYDDVVVAPAHPTASMVHETPVPARYQQETSGMKSQLIKAWSRHMRTERDRESFHVLLSAITVDEVNVSRKIVLLSANGLSLSREFAIPYFWEPSDFDRIVAAYFGGFGWTDHKSW